MRPKKNICVFQVSRPYLGFCPNPKHFIVNCKQNVLKFAGKWGKCIEKCNFYIKYFDKIKCYADRSYLVFFRAENWNTHIYIFFFCLKYGSRKRVRRKIRHPAALDGCECAFGEMSLRTKYAIIPWAGSNEARDLEDKRITGNIFISSHDSSGSDSNLRLIVSSKWNLQFPGFLYLTLI